ncbi:MAG: RHS repeat-associated core domain-containing protein [Carboxylicivirga sp.]|jgi:RHS repeat-associated protein|nr:RHS repeat-associated core domain-containing protein [Carboxylicivirga sp.]
MKKHSIILIAFVLFGTLSLWAQEKGQGFLWNKGTSTGLIFEDRENIIIKEAEEGWKNAGATSRKKLPITADGEISFNLQNRDHMWAIGFAPENENPHFESIKFGYLFSEKSCQLIFDGKIVSEISRYERGDHFSIRKEGDVILYVQNKMVLLAESIDIRILYADISIYTPGPFTEAIEIVGDWVLSEPIIKPVNCVELNDNYNWIHAKTYDFDGNVTSESMSFSDAFGKSYQNQTKDLTDGVVHAQQPIYDAFGRPVLQSLSAPIYHTEFCVKTNFIEKENGSEYAYDDFDKPYNSGSGSINSPRKIKKTEKGSVGWYYSSNNNEEDFVDQTSYPYSRIEYSKSNPGQERKVSAPGNVFKMGSGNEVKTYSMAASSELYYVYGYTMDWNTNSAGTGWQLDPINTDYQVVKTINVDQDDKEVISFTDHDGKTLASCVSGISNPIQTVASTIKENKGYVDIHLPKLCNNSLLIHFPSLSVHPDLRIRILDLSNDKFWPPSNNTPTPTEYKKGDQISLPPGYYRIEHIKGILPNEGLNISYQLNYERFTLHYYDLGKRLVRTIPPKGIDNSYVPQGTLTSLSQLLPLTTAYSNSQTLNVNQPANLQTTTNEQSAIISLSVGVPLIMEAIDVGDVETVPYDAYQSGIQAMARVANNTPQNVPSILQSIQNDRISAFGTRQQKDAAAASSPVTAYSYTADNPYQVMALPVSFIQNINSNNGINNATLASLANISNFPGGSINQLPTGGGSTPIGGGTPAGPTIPNGTKTTSEFIVSYDLGYHDGSSFIALATNRRFKMIRNFKVTLTDGSTSGVNSMSYSHLTDNTLQINNITSDYPNLQKYQAKITNVRRKEYIKTSFGYSVNNFNNIDPNTFTNELQAIGNILNYGQYGNYARVSLNVQNISGANQPNHTMANTYDYNSLNWLLSTSSPDEGVSKFVYRDDGQIRFSQNQKQLTANKISYTEYDKLGRPVESGETDLNNTNFQFQDHYNEPSLPTGPGATISSTNAYVNNSNTPGAKSNTSNIIYDIADASIPIVTGLTSNDLKQTFVSGNVSKTYNNDVATWYSYDAYGRVKWILREYNALSPSDKHKYWKYHYDGAGNVTQVDFQPQKNSESFYHKYTYDNNNRLNTVSTSSTASGNFKQHARYYYYQHGPLKRVELGNKLQGIDYVYTINGMLKSINTPEGINDFTKDPGRDSDVAGGNGFKPDKFAMALDYHPTDYLGNASVRQVYKQGSAIVSPGMNYQDPLGTAHHNGSIKSQHWKRPGDGTTNQNAYIYKYDAFNQLNEAFMASYAPPSQPSGNIYPPPAPTFTTTDKYKVEGITYDENGNILTLKRNNESGASMDNLTYQYSSNTNQLQLVQDAVLNSPDLDDIEDQSSNSPNYIYNNIGQLIEDKSQGITYEYNTEGLVTKVICKSNNNPWVEFKYDDAGFRYQKIQYTDDGTGKATTTVGKTSNYINDISGQTMMIQDIVSGTNNKYLYPIMGSSRVGLFTKAMDASGSSLNQKFQYELKDHLGNVREKIETDLSGAIIPANSFRSDYYPFGMQMPGLQVNNYRFGYQGEYAEDETEEKTKANTFQLRLYDARIGRWLTTDPKGQYHSPYLAMGNNPVSRVDPDGGADGWVKPEGGAANETYFDPNINSASEAAAAGVDWVGMSFYDANGLHYGVNGDITGFLNEIELNGFQSAHEKTMSNPVVQKIHLGQIEFATHPVTLATANTLSFVATGGIEGITGLYNLGRSLYLSRQAIVKLGVESFSKAEYAAFRKISGFSRKRIVNETAIIDKFGIFKKPTPNEIKLVVNSLKKHGAKQIKIYTNTANAEAKAFLNPRMESGKGILGLTIEKRAFGGYYIHGPL